MWTKSQKISGAVLGLAVVAFGVDRFVLGSGAPTATESAEQLVVSRSSDAAITATKPPVQVAASQAVTLANRLASFAETRKLEFAKMGDAFEPSKVWVARSLPPAPPKKPAPAKAVAAAPKVDHAGNFIKRHTLTAVMIKQKGGMAIVDGKLYRVGQAIDGFTLQSLGLSDATFTGNGTKVTLKLATALTDAR